MPPGSKLPQVALFLLMLISLYLPKLTAHLAFENWPERIMPFNKTRSLLCKLLHLATGILLIGSKHRPSASPLPGAPLPRGSSVKPGSRPTLRHVIPLTEEPQHVMVGRGQRERAGQRLMVQKEKVRPPARGWGRGDTRLVQGHDPMRLELQALAPSPALPTTRVSACSFFSTAQLRAWF